MTEASTSRDDTAPNFRIRTDDCFPFDDTPSYDEWKELDAGLHLLTEQQSALIAELEAETAQQKSDSVVFVPLFGVSIRPVNS
jgi:hypothetical protein